MDIKYRAWDKVFKKMYIVERLYFSEDGTLTHVGIDCENVKDEIQIIDIKFIELMQSTGVLDCKGKEAYEGDILKDSPYRDTDSTQYGVIKRESDTCSLYVEWNFKRTYEGKTYWDKNIFPLRKIKELEVVGDIYQNKDLLEEG